jgi:hypothetical protein
VSLAIEPNWKLVIGNYELEIAETEGLAAKVGFWAVSTN